MPEDNKQGSDLAGKLKQANTQVSNLQRQLQESRDKVRELEEESRWNADLTGGDAAKIKQTIMDANLEIKRREDELATKEAELAKTQLSVDATSIATEFGIEVSEIQTLETSAEMRVKALELQNTKLKEDWTKLEEMKKAGGNYEHGSASGGVKDVKGMTSEQFEEHLKGLKAEAEAKK